MIRLEEQFPVPNYQFPIKCKLRICYNEIMNSKFDSEAFYERLYKFALDCRKLIKKLPKTNYNFEDEAQLIRSSGSMGANYIEALEALSRKDFIFRLKISRKETRESIHWLGLIKDSNETLGEIVNEAKRLISEGTEIKKILTKSIMTSESR